MKEYVPKTKPFRHQAEEFEISKDLPARAIFWEQGTGKSKITIDTAGHLYASGKIDCVIVVAPSGVHLNWVTDEIPTHMPDWIREELYTHVYSTDRAATKAHQAACERLVSHKGLAFLAITYDSIKTQRAKELLWALLQNRKVLYVADESQRIKTPKAVRRLQPGAVPGWGLLEAARAGPVHRLQVPLRHLEEAEDLRGPPVRHARQLPPPGRAERNPRQHQLPRHEGRCARPAS